MIALLLALAADPPAIDGLPLGALAQQALPVKGCAAYLFTTGEKPALVAMATADLATLRIALAGKTADYARASQIGDGSFGFAATTEYRAGDIVATLDLTIATRSDLTDGAVVSAATLRIDRPGADGIAVPLGGLIGCAKQ